MQRLIDDGILPGEQILPFAPWQIPESALTDARVLEGVAAVIARRPRNLDYTTMTTLTLPFDAKGMHNVT